MNLEHDIAARQWQDVQQWSKDEIADIVAGRRHVGILQVETVGNYALRIKFDDLHDTGIYTWNYLYELGENQDANWKTYLAEMAERGFSCDP